MLTILNDFGFSPRIRKKYGKVTWILYAHSHLVQKNAMNRSKID